MVLMYLEDENSVYIEDYIYKPLQGKHTLIVRNDRNTPVEVNINRQVKSLDINKIYNHRIENNSSYEFDFPIDDTIPPNILSLFIDRENTTYDNKTDLINVPYIVPEGNDNINPVYYYISAEDSFSKVKLFEDIEFIPDSNSVDGITEIWYKFDNDEKNLPNYKSGQLEKVNEEKIGSLLFYNTFKYNELYLHLFSKDASGNVSEEYVIEMDIEVPSFVTDGYKINGTELYEGIELDSFNGNTLFDFTQVKTTRDMDVYYDIQLVSVNKKTGEEILTGKSFNKTLYPGEIDLEFTPIDIDNELYEYYVNIRTSNRYGRTLGFKRSPMFKFKVKQDFNVDYISVDESPIVAFDADGSNSINSKDKTLIIGYSGYNRSDLNKEVAVHFRYRDTRDKSIPASEWKFLTSKFLGTTNGEIRIPFDTAILDPNGFKIYDFQVSKKYSDDIFIRKTKYDLMADSHVVNDEQTSNYFTAVKIPVEVLRNMEVQVQEDIQGEIFKSEKISIDNDLTCHGFSKTSAYFIATNKFSTDINMSRPEDMDLMRNEIRGVINTNNFKIDSSIIRPYEEDMESYVVFERGNVELNQEFWNNKVSSPTDSPFIKQYKGIETSIVTFIGNDEDKKVVLKDDYRLYRRNNLPIPEVLTNISPEIVTEDDGSETLIFSNPVYIKAINNFGLEIDISYEYTSENEENPTDLFTEYEQGTLLEDQGHYSFNIRSCITYGLETFYSDPNFYEFDLIYEDVTFRTPVFRELVGSDGKITLTLETNTNDERYSYTFYDSNTNEDITDKFTKYDEDTTNIKYKYKIEDYGIYNFTVNYTNGIFEDDISTVVVYNEDLGKDSTIEGILKYHKSTDTKLSNRYNNAYLETKVKTVSDLFSVADIEEDIDGQKKNSRLVISSGYNIPFYYPTVLKMFQSSVNNKYRDHIHDPDSKKAEDNPLESGKGHKTIKLDSTSVQRVDANLIPDKPIISLFSKTPIEGKFNKFPNENDENIVMDSVDINVTNGDSDWETEIMINGEKFKDTNTTYDVSGNHKIVAIFRDRFNYTMNYATANINIKKDYLYSPINMDLYSLKDKFTGSEDRYNLLSYGEEFNQNDIDKFIPENLRDFKLIEDENGKNYLNGTVIPEVKEEKPSEDLPNNEERTETLSGNTSIDETVESENSEIPSDTEGTTSEGLENSSNESEETPSEELPIEPKEDIKLIESTEQLKIKSNKDYIYSVVIGTPGLELNEESMFPNVKDVWFDGENEEVLESNELVRFEKLENDFYKLTYKIHTNKNLTSENPHFKFILKWESGKLPENQEINIQEISLIQSSNEDENVIGNLGTYSKEDLIQEPLSITANGYLVDITYFFITDEILRQRNILNIDSEESLCKKKQYRIDNGNWIDYTENTRIIVKKACVIEARKVMIDETIIRESLEITPDMMGYNLPIPPVFIGTEYNNKEEGYSYFPVIEKHMGHTYRLELNGLPFDFNIPIVSNGSINDYEEYELTAYSKHYKFPDKEAKTTIRFKAKNKPPERPYLEGIKDKEINHVTDKDFRLNIVDKEEDTVYYIKVNDRILNDGDKLFDTGDYKLNGVFVISVIAKNKIGLTSYNSYYIDNNRNVADEYHELDYDRNVLILNSRDKRAYEFNNEMIMDLRTGDISYTDDKRNLIDVTAGLKEKLKIIESNLNNININSMLMRGNISLLLDELSYIRSNNDFLEDNLKKSIDKLENVNNEVDKSDKLISDIEKLRKKVDKNMKLVDRLSKSVDTKTKEINKLVGKIEKEIIDTLPVQRDNISLVAKSYYNIKSVDIVARTKVSKVSFRKFKNKYEKFLTNVRNYIRNF